MATNIDRPVASIMADFLSTASAIAISAATADAKVTALNGTVLALTGDKTALQGQVATLNGTVTTLQATIAAGTAGGTGLAGTFDISTHLATGDVIFELTPPAGYTLALAGAPIAQAGINGNNVVRLGGLIAAGSLYMLALKWTDGDPKHDQPFTLTFKATDSTPRLNPYVIDSVAPGQGFTVGAPDYYVVLGDVDQIKVPFSLHSCYDGRPLNGTSWGTLGLTNSQTSDAINTGSMTPVVSDLAVFPGQNARGYASVTMDGAAATQLGQFGVVVGSFGDEVPQATATAVVHVVENEEQFPAGFDPHPFDVSSTPVPVWDAPPRAQADYHDDFLNWTLTTSVPTGKYDYKVDLWSINEDAQKDFNHSFGFVIPGQSTAVSGRVITEADVFPKITDAQGTRRRWKVIDLNAEVDPANSARRGLAYKNGGTKRFASPAIQLFNNMRNNYGWIELDADITIPHGFDCTLWRFMKGAEELDLMESLDKSGRSNTNFTAHAPAYSNKWGTAPRGRSPLGRQLRRWKFTEEKIYYFTADPDGSNCVLEIVCPNFFRGMTWDFFNLMIEGPGGAGGSDYNPDIYDFSNDHMDVWGMWVWETDGKNDITPLPSWTVDPVLTGEPRVGWPLTTSRGAISYGYATGYQWHRDDGAIVGQTAASYTPVVGDVGHTVWCEIAATGQYGDNWRTTAPVTIVARDAAPAAGYTNEATALFGRMTTPLDGASKFGANKLIAAMKSAGIWQKLLGFYAATGTTADQNLLNWIGNTFPASLKADSGALPTFDAAKGWVFSGTNRIEIAFDPATQGGALWSAASASVTQRTTTPAAAGVTSLQVGNTYIAPRYNAQGAELCAINGGDAAFDPNTASRGTFSLSRTDASGFVLYRNGIPKKGSNGTFIGGGAAGATSSGTLVVTGGAGWATSYVAFGAGLTRAEVKAMQEAFSAYRKGMGIG